MNKPRVRWILIAILCLVAIVILPGGSLLARAGEETPAEMVQHAWKNAQQAGSYRFISDINQTLVPRPVPEMIGQQETEIDLAIDGATVLPDRAYSEMRIQTGQSSQSVAILRDGQQSFMLQDGELKPVESTLNMASQSSDVLSYLAAADQVALLDPPQGHPEITRYGYIINGSRYAEYIRQQTESALQAEPGAPQGLTVKPLSMLQNLSGQGELWVNAAGFPVRQVLKIEMPEVNEQYDAQIDMRVDLSDYGQVETLPQAVQNGDGTWRLDGMLVPNSSSTLGAFPGFGTLPVQSISNSPAHSSFTASWWASLVSRLPLRLSPTSVILFVLALLFFIIIRYYRRNPRRCYALIVFTLIPIMVFSPILESAGVVSFMERQAQAAEASAKAMPDLLKALGFSPQEIEAATANQESTVRADVKANEADSAPLITKSQMTTSALTGTAPRSVNQQQSSAGGMQRCGEGTPGADTDSDGLTDSVELCLGTNPRLADTDQDAIPDKTELNGFEYPVGSGKYWTSDPMNPDSNSDGLIDTMEWPTTATLNGQTITTKGQASSVDLNNDGIPNLWDGDDDGDGVPDAQDLSPQATTGAAPLANLSIAGSGFQGYETIEIQVRPDETDHLRYSTTALDWPLDDEGNVKDLDDSTDDLRLTPFLIVTTNVAPDQTLADKYGFRSWQNTDGKFILMAPLAPVQENGAIHSYYAKIAYGPSQTADIQWQAQMVWMAEMQSDYSQNLTIKTQTQTLHEYQDSFRITGMKITKDKGYEAAVFGTPDQQDDLMLFQLLLGLNDTFKSYLSLKDQTSNTVLQEIASRFADKGATVFNIPANKVDMAGPVSYGHMDAAMSGIGSDLVPNFLGKYDSQYYGTDRCNDADGNLVSCASLIIAFESSMGVRDLSDLPGGASGTVDLAQLHINLADVPLLTTRGVQMHVYEKATSGDWQMTTTARMLELMELRYKDNNGIGMRTLYPDLTVEDVRFITYAAYLWATSPSYNAISVDAQVLVDEEADVTALENNWILPPEQEAEKKTAIDYFGMGTNIAAILTTATSSYIGWTLGDAHDLFFNWGLLDTSTQVWSSVGVGLSVVTNTASMLMGIANSICNAGVKCNAKALKAANIAMQSLSILGQVQQTADLIYKYVTGALEPLSKMSTGISVVGLVIGISMAWVSFGLTLAFGGLSNPVVWRNALANAIMTTIWLVIMFIIQCIPVIGQVIGAIMAVLDGLFQLFTWLFGGSAQSISQALLKLFYDAEVCTNIGDGSVSFGEFSTVLSDPKGGLLDGNTFIVSAPFEGALYETGFGKGDDLTKSSIQGTLTEQYNYYSDEEKAVIFPSQDKSELANCVIDHTVKYCSNSAALGFLLTPRINGIVPVQTVAKYTIVWAAFGMAGAYRYSTHTMDGTMPEDVDKLKPTFMYLDVLPNNVTDLWSWSELTNNDPDGDGLTNAQEGILGTSTTNWDSDGDEVSDYYEWQIGTKPNLPDTDGDGLDDGLEIRLGTNPTQADSDGDGLKDGEEVRHYDSVSESLVGGWQVTIDNVSYPVSSDPKKVDTDGDSLNDAEEKTNLLSPHTANELVPLLSMSVSPLSGVAGGMAGAYWQPNEEVQIDIHLANGSPDPVDQTLTLKLPDFLGNIRVGTMQGDRTPSLSVNPNQLDWSFSGADALQTYEYVDVSINATTTNASGSGKIDLSLPFGNLTLDKAVNVVMDADDPDVAVLAPADDAYLRGSSYVVGGLATDPTTWITDTVLSINGSNVHSFTDGSNPWAYTWTWDGEGVYTIQAQAWDVMGHQKTSDQVSVTVDNTDPTVTLSYEMSGNIVMLSGKASDNLAGIAWVQLSLDGQPWRSVTFDESGNWSFDWTVGESSQGEHEARVMAIDRSGNQSDIAPVTITVDSVAPSSIVNSGADADVPPEVKPGASFDITGVADEGGHLPLPAVPADLQTGMKVFDDSTLWLGISTIHDNDGGVLAAWIGDFNADRLADLAVGLPGPDGNTGQVSILYGRAGGWSTPPDLDMLATSPTRFSGASGTRLGSLLAAAGDANGDNFSDLLIGERDSSRAFLVFGSPGPLGDVTLDSGHSGYQTLLQAPVNAKIEGLATAGDVNGDGYADLLVQAGGKAYLIFGRMTPWPETIDLATEASSAATFSGTTGALGVGDVNSDQFAEWVTLANGFIYLYSWNAGSAALVKTFTTADADPRAVALGDVDNDGIADWLYSSGAGCELVYGYGTSSDLNGCGGFFAAPGDVDGDGRADILLTDENDLATLVHLQNGSLDTFATIAGVGGAANAPYAAGADLNSDGSSDLLLIPDQATAQQYGFDAPDFSSGFVSPQSLPLGVASVIRTSEEPPITSQSMSSRFMRAHAMEGFGIQSAGSDTRYVDDDAVNSTCDGHNSCYATIQQAVDLSDGGGDIIIVYPGVYTRFIVPVGTIYDHLTIKGVSADAVFIDGAGTGNAITVSADGVRLSNLTVRNAVNGIVLQDGAGESPTGGGNESFIDHVLAHSVQTPISMSPASSLSLSDSTLVGNGSDAIINVASGSSSVNSWNNDQAVSQPIGGNGALASAGGSLYALPGGDNSTIYNATPGSTGALGSWSTAFSLKDALPPTNPPINNQGTNALVGSSSTLWQVHSTFRWPGYGTLANGYIQAIAIDPLTNDIYVGGEFTTIGGVNAAHIARWDGTQWNKIGDPNVLADNGVDGPVYVLDFVPNYNNMTYQYDLYIGGNFSHYGYDATTQTGYPAGNVVRRRGNQWLPVGQEGSANGHPGNGVNGPVRAIAHDNTGYYIFIGGSFTQGYIGATPFASDNVIRFRWDMTLAASDGDVNGAVYTLYLHGNWNSGYLYVGGSFTQVGNVAATNVARCTLSGAMNTNVWTPMSFPQNTVYDLVLDLQGHLDLVRQGSGVYQWNGASWVLLEATSGYTYNDLAVDSVGNVYATGGDGIMSIQYGGSGAFIKMGNSNPFGGAGWTYAIQESVVTENGQLYVVSGGYNYNTRTAHGALERFTPGSVYRRSVSDTSWSQQPYPPSYSVEYAPTAQAADQNGNLYAAVYDTRDGLNRMYHLATGAWETKAAPPSNLTLASMAWAGNYLYALAHPPFTYTWSILQYDPSLNQWTTLAAAPIPSGAVGAGLSWAWDGSDHIYMLRGDGSSDFTRYRISTNSWESLAPVSFPVSYGPAMARIGSYLYVYGTGSQNLYRYGSLPASDLRLAIDRTAFVVPDTASTFTWTNLGAAAGSLLFQTDIDTSNAWVGPTNAPLSPAFSNATRLTSAQADFVAPANGLYRLDANSILTVGYHHYTAVAHVYPSQADCALCGSGPIWGVDAFATIREAVESGAARVLVHPGRYPQTFYLVSGVEVIGSGVELTIIEASANATGTLVTAEGVAGSSLARMTLAGGSGWEGFLAEGGAKGLKLTRTVIRDLKTGVHLRGGSEVEIANNTLVHNTNGIAIDGTTPVNVRNTIFAYNSGVGLAHGASPTSLSNTYNDFWSNGTDMSPEDVSLGSLFVDPLFRGLATNDLRLGEKSPLIDRGNPSDPTTPGGGERVDIGYAESNNASFYVSKDYSETGLDDGLTWGIDAFANIQDALNAAKATLYGLQGALPEGGYSVAVDAGTYNEQVTVPSLVRLVGSGAATTTIEAGNTGGAVTFDGVIDAELSGFTIKNTGGVGIEIKNNSSEILIERNVIASNASHGISLAGQSSAKVLFNTFVSNLNGAGVFASGSRVWADVRNNILDGNATGLQADSGALIHNSYNLLNSTTTNFSGVTKGEGTVEAAVSFEANSYYVPSATSPAIDAAEPWVDVPPAGGLRADLGYKELIASPLTLIFGPQIASTVTGNSGVAKVELGVVLVSDPTRPITDTIPTTWETLTPTQTGEPLYYWSHSENQATRGLYRVYTRATDMAGNTETVEQDWYEGAFVVDEIAPTVSWGTTLPSPTDAAAILAVINATGTVSTTTGTRSDVAQTYFSVTHGTTTLSYPAEGGQAWIPLPATGNYTIQAIAVDEAGNQASQSASITVNASNSVATVSNYLPESSVNSTTITLRGYVRFITAGNGQVSVSVTGGSTNVQATLDSPGAAFSAWSAAITLPSGDGAKSISVTPTGGTATNLSLTLDMTAPSLGVTSPADGETIQQTTTFSGTASDAGAGLARVEVSVDGGYTWKQATLNSTDWTLAWTFSTMQDGASYPVKVRAVDKAGNTTVVARPVIVDNMPPSGLTPITFSEPVGQHLEIGSSLSITWTTPVDASGSVLVFLNVDQIEDTVPFSQVSGTSSSFTPSILGDYYMHLMTQDAKGNQKLIHYGPWHIRDMKNATFSSRHQSIILDGAIDLDHNEWLSNDLLGTDVQELRTQKLYATWDGEAIYLGWSGAWWTLDGAMWAYLNVASGGTTGSIDGSITLPFEADVAVLIGSPDSGSLYTYNGTSWVPSTNPLDFGHGSNGDTEARIPWALDASQSVQLVAFAVSPDEEQNEVLPLAQSEVMSSVKNAALSSSMGMALLDAPGDSLEPWAVFPDTNPLGQDILAAYEWTTPVVDVINLGQPEARTVTMEVNSAQDLGTAQCETSFPRYNIVLHNLETATISGLTVSLATTPGINGFREVTGATYKQTSTGWNFSVPSIPAGGAHTIGIIIVLPTLNSHTSINLAFSLSAGNTPLTGSPSVTLTQRVDGQPPVVTFDPVPGWVIGTGLQTIKGLATDGTGAGVSQVKYNINYSGWQNATGIQAWSASLNVSGSSDLTVMAQAVDVCGFVSNPFSASATFHVDSTSPGITWTLPTAITSTLTTITGTTVDPAPAGSLVQSVELQLDSDTSAWHAAIVPPLSGTQNWTWGWIFPQEDGETHTIRVRASDQVGNNTTTAWQNTIVDVVAPQIAATLQTTSPILSGTVSDGSGVRGVSVLIYDPQGNESTQPATLTDGTWAYTPNIAGWVVGTYALRVQAVDIYGNISMKGPYLFEVTDEMLEHPGIAITAVTVDGSTEGDGLNILAGEPITWKYTLTNTGDVALSSISMTDSVTDVTPTYLSGDANSDAKLDLTETWIYQATGTAAAGNYTNTGTASGTSQSGVNLTAQDGSSYFGANPQIAINKVTSDGSTEGDGNEFLVDTAITWRYTVTNGGNVPLSSPSVTDNVSGVSPTYANGDTNSDGKLDQTETWIYEANGKAIVGPYNNTGTASGSYSDSAGDSKTVTKEDISSYTGTKADATVTLSSSLNPSTYREQVSLTATVSGEHGVPTGKVTFRDGNNALADCVDLDLANGQRVCDVPLFTAGTHSLTVEYSGDSIYLPGSEILVQEVNKATANLSLSGLDYNYDGTFREAIVTKDPADLTGVTVTYNGGDTLPKDAGSYAVVASLNNPNYQAADATGTLVIHPIPLIVTADDKGREYLQSNPEFTVSYSGFVGGEDVSVLSGAPELSTDATENSPAGDYVINVTVGTLSAANYTFEFVAGTLTIGQTNQTITFDPLPDKTYGDEDFEVAATASSGLVVSFSVGENDACTITDKLVHITAAGSCTVTAFQEGDENYTAAIPVSQRFTILPRPTSIQLNDLSQVYDGTEKAVTVITEPAGVAVLVTYDGNATLPVNAGSYAVVVTINDSNYQGDPASGTLVIDPRPITVSADARSKTYGDDNPFLTATVVGVVEGETVDYSLSTIAVTLSDVGPYPIIVTLGDNPNYNITKSDAILTINPKPATVIADNKAKIYGDANPALTAVVTGQVEGGAVIGYSLSTTAGECSDVGNYPINVTLEANPNYSVTQTNGTLTINPKVASVTANNKTKTYGDDNPELTASVVGNVASCTPIAYSLSTSAEKLSGVGDYPIVVNLGTNSNYNVTKTDGNLSISAAKLTVTADNQTKAYSDPNPSLTFTYAGWITGESPTEPYLITAPTCTTTRTSDSPAGDYPITCSGGLAPNYQFTYIDGTFTVSKETATITYTGDTQVTTAKAGAKATVTLAATLEEDQDGSLGKQLTGQKILFQVYTFGADMNTATPLTTCTATVGNVAGGKGYGSCTVSLGAADPYQVKISLVTNPYYTANYENVTIVVNDPGTGMTAGGGWLVDPNTSSRVSFGFTVKFLKNGNIQGNSLFIYRVMTDLSQLVPGAPVGTREYNWIIKSNALQGLNIYNCPVGAKSGCKATITAKNNVQAVDRLTGILYSLGGNYQFQVDVTDNREPGSTSTTPDQYAIRVWNASGLYYMLGNTYDANGKLLAPLDIRGGNIQVKAK